MSFLQKKKKSTPFSDNCHFVRLEIYHRSLISLTTTNVIGFRLGSKMFSYLITDVTLGRLKIKIKREMFIDLI
jgi:hypothetical protein